MNALETKITTYWWNMGIETEDFSGTYKEWMKINEVKMKPVKHPTVKDAIGLRFKFKTGQLICTIDDFSDEISAFDTIIKMHLTYLGDKAIFINGYGREYKINWR